MLVHYRGRSSPLTAGLSNWPWPLSIFRREGASSVTSLLFSYPAGDAKDLIPQMDVPYWGLLGRGEAFLQGAKSGSADVYGRTFQKLKEFGRLSIKRVLSYQRPSSDCHSSEVKARASILRPGEREH